MARKVQQPVNPIPAPQLEEFEPYYQAVPLRVQKIGPSTALDQMYEYFTQL